MPNPWLQRRILLFAHQGGELEAPSNTMYAFRSAVAKGAHALEMDLHCTADGHVVISHDPTVDRTTDATGRIDGFTLAQIKALDAAYWFVPGRDAVRDEDPARYPLRGVATGRQAPPDGYSAEDFAIPTLREVLEAFPGVMLNMDIKQTRPHTKPYEQVVAGMLAEFGRADDVIVASFHDSAISVFRQIAPQVTTAAALDESTAFYRGDAISGDPAYHALQMPSSRFGRQIVTPELVERCHECGIAIHPWTVNDEQEMRVLIGMGVDGVITSRPTLLAGVLDELGCAYRA